MTDSSPNLVNHQIWWRICHQICHQIPREPSSVQEGPAVTFRRRPNIRSILQQFPRLWRVFVSYCVPQFTAHIEQMLTFDLTLLILVEKTWQLTTTPIDVKCFPGHPDIIQVFSLSLRFMSAFLPPPAVTEYTRCTTCSFIFPRACALSHISTLFHSSLGIPDYADYLCDDATFH